MVGNDRSPIVQWNGYKRSFNGRQKEVVETVVQWSEKVKDEHDCLTIMKKDRLKRSFNDLQNGQLKTIVQRSQNEVVESDHTDRNVGSV